MENILYFYEYFPRSLLDKYGWEDFANDVEMLGNPHCSKTKTNPDFSLCTYTASEDTFVSKPVLEIGLYRPDLASALRTFCESEDPGSSPEAVGNLVFLDAGSHVGYFSQLAAKLGYEVYAIDPLRINVLRAYAAAQLNDVSINLYR